MQKSICSFIKNRKERKDLSILLKRMDAQPWKKHHMSEITHTFKWNGTFWKRHTLESIHFLEMSKPYGSLEVINSTKPKKVYYCLLLGLLFCYPTVQ